VKRSSLIVTGEVVSIAKSVATIEIADVLKGAVGEDGTVEVSLATPPAVGRIAVGDSGVWLIDQRREPPQLLGGGVRGASERAVREELGVP